MSEFVQKIYNWYRENRRQLPWRETTDPYKIWLSEIILQQTRVEQGRSYYLRFIEKYPSVTDLAAAPEDEVLKLWQGLGYYSRARNLHHTARLICRERNGKFPESYKELLELKGVGPYTAAAIASIAYDLPHAAVDGNIFRVLARYFGIASPIDSGKGKREFTNLAKELLHEENSGFHNQAMMEFGALQCIPKSPDCTICPAAESCYAHLNGKIDKLPVKLKQTKQRRRFFYYYYIDAGNYTFLQKRTTKDIWQNLFQFPLKESQSELTEKNLFENDNTLLPASCKMNIRNISHSRKHILSHQIIIARLIHVEIKNLGCLNGNFLQVNKKDIFKFAVPRLVEKFIQELELDKN